MKQNKSLFQVDLVEPHFSIKEDGIAPARWSILQCQENCDHDHISYNYRQKSTYNSNEWYPLTEVHTQCYDGDNMNVSTVLASVEKQRKSSSIPTTPTQDS